MKALGVALSLLLLAGCTGGGNTDDPDAGPAPAGSSPSADQAASLVEALPTSAERSWSTRLDPLAQPVVAGDVLIAAVAARRDEVDVVALDRADGAVLWRKPLMVVHDISGPSLGALVFESAAGDTYVVMQQASESGQAPFLALEPRTGKVVARTRPVVAQLGARVCDEGHDACLRITEGSYEETRWELGSWRLRPEEGRWPDGGERYFAASDVYSVFASVGSFYGVSAIGRVGSSPWRVPSNKITQGKGWEIDYLSGFIDEEAGVVVVPIAHVSGETVTSQQGLATVRGQLSRYRTVGLDLDNGKVLWRHDGTGLLCLNLSRWEDVPVRCSVHGVVSDQSARSTSEPRRAWLEGFDPRTGEVTWQEDLDPGVVRSLFRRPPSGDPSLTYALAADDLAVVSGPDGPRLLSLLDGSSSPVDDADVLLCSAPVKEQDGPGSEALERDTAVPCAPGGKRLGQAKLAELGPVGLLTGAVDVGDGMRALSTPSSIEAFQLS